FRFDRSTQFTELASSGLYITRSEVIHLTISNRRLVIRDNPYHIDGEAKVLTWTVTASGMQSLRRRGENIMFQSIKCVVTLVGVVALLAMTAVVASAQQTTGSVSMSAAVSNYVELVSGGAVTLSGNSGGSVVTDGTVNSQLAVVVDMGELGPDKLTH